MKSYYKKAPFGSGKYILDDLKKGIVKSKNKSSFKKLATKASRRFLKDMSNEEELEIITEELYKKIYYVKYITVYDENLDGDIEYDLKKFVLDKKVYKYNY
jgi:hypothetical protein